MYIGIHFSCFGLVITGSSLRPWLHIFFFWGGGVPFIGGERDYIFGNYWKILNILYVTLGQALLSGRLKRATVKHPSDELWWNYGVSESAKNAWEYVHFALILLIEILGRVCFSRITIPQSGGLWTNSLFYRRRLGLSTKKVELKQSKLSTRIKAVKIINTMLYFVILCLTWIMLQGRSQVSH